MDFNDELRNKIISEQYRRCAEDCRHFDKLLWQIPFSTATVVSAVIAIALGYYGKEVLSVPMEVRTPLFVLLIVFVITMASLSRKIRVLQEARTAFAEDIAEKVSTKKVPVRTEEALEFLYEKRGESKKLVRYRAIHFSNLLYLLFTSVLLYLLYREGSYGIIAIIVTIGLLCFVLLYDRICALLRQYYY